MDSQLDLSDQRRREGYILPAVLLGILLSSVTVLTASRAALSAQTSNESSHISAGDVTLTDDDSDSSLFEVTNMAPGDVATGCIEVTYSGSIADPGAVKAFSGGFTDSGSLATELNLTVEEGIGGSFADCSGFASSSLVYEGTLAGFDATHGDYLTGAGTWDPSATPESRTYRIVVELDADADNGIQGESVTDLVFVWEVQS